MTLEDGVRRSRGVGPRLLVLVVGMTAGVGVFRSTHSLGARLNTTSDYPLHHSRCSKLTTQPTCLPLSHICNLPKQV